MQEQYYRGTGILNSQIQDMSVSQSFEPGKKWKQTFPAIAETLSECTTRDQDIFTLIFNDNVSYRKIAEIHNISAARVGQIKNRIIHKIKRKVIETGVEC